MSRLKDGGPRFGPFTDKLLVQKTREQDPSPSQRLQTSRFSRGGEDFFVIFSSPDTRDETFYHLKKVGGHTEHKQPKEECYSDSFSII